MERKSKLCAYAAIIAFGFSAMIFGGGCGGGGSSPQPQPKADGHILQYDSDNDGIPDVFEDYLAEGASGDVYDKASGDSGVESSAAAASSPFMNTVDRGSIYKLPKDAFDEDQTYNLPLRRTGELDSGYLAQSSGATSGDAASGDAVVYRDRDLIKINLEGGKTYTLLFKERGMTGRTALAFVPELNILSGEEYEKYEKNENYTAVKFDVLDADRSTVKRSAAVSFTAPASGIYAILLGNQGAEDKDTPLSYAFDIFEDTNKSGQFIRFSSSDGSRAFNYKLEDILKLRSELNKYVEERDPLTGEPVKMGEGAESAFNDMLARVNVSYGLTDDAAQTDELLGTPRKKEVTLAATVKDQRWIPSVHEIGGGVCALTGAPSMKKTAIAAFTPENPATQSAVFTSDSLVIDNVQKHEELLKVSTSGNFNSALFTIKGTADVTKNVKYSDKSLTVAISITKLETEPRKLQDDAKYKLTDAAAKLLKSGNKERFYEDYGEYFVAGAYYGGTYTGYLTIEANSIEKLQEVAVKVETTLNASKTADGAVSASTQNQIKSLLANTTTKFHEEIRGYTPKLKQTKDDVHTYYGVANSVDDIFENARVFLNECRHENFKPVPLRPYLQLYAALPAVEEISDLSYKLAADPQAFRDAGYAAERFLQYSNLVNVMSNIPVEHFADNKSGYSETREKMRKDWDATMSDFIADQTNFMTSAEAREQWKAFFNEEIDRYFNMYERYKFYRALLAWRPKQENWLSHGKTDYDFDPWHDFLEKRYEYGFTQWLPCRVIHDTLAYEVAKESVYGSCKELPNKILVRDLSGAGMCYYRISVHIPAPQGWAFYGYFMSGYEPKSNEYPGLLGPINSMSLRGVGYSGTADWDAWYELTTCSFAWHDDFSKFNWRVTND